MAILPRQMGPDPAFGSVWFNFLIILGEDMRAKDGLCEARVTSSRGLEGSWVSLTDHAVPSISLSEQSLKGGLLPSLPGWWAVLRFCFGAHPWTLLPQRG